MVSEVLQETISSVDLIKIFVNEDREIKRFSEKLKNSLHANVNQNTLSAFAQLGIGVISTIGSVLVLWIGSREIILGRLTVGGFIAFNSYLAYLYGPSKYLATMSVHIQSSFAALKRVTEIFDLIPESFDASNKKLIKRFNGSIVFKNVSFAYGSYPVLESVNFSIQAGEKIALVGPSGSGKTTLLSLMLCLYQPTEGEILFDGLNSRNLQLRLLRDRIGVVSQEILLLNDTVMNNIKYSNPAATEEEVIRAARLAHVHDFVRHFPEKYRTVVGERGRNLSIGQKQRISIARALLKNPDIFIFDEPTSALDVYTEKIVRKVIFKITEGKTVIIIAHRLSTVVAVDRIFVLNDGKIAQAGTHSELMEEEGFYRHMHQQYLTPA